MSIRTKNKGYLLVLALVFGAVMFALMVAFLGFIVIENRAQTLKINKERALDVAEAGLDYYKWYLSHFPNDVNNGYGTTTPGPYIHTYDDPETGTIGQFSLGISGNSMCGEITSIDIHSTGTVSSAPGVERSVYGRYARPTVSEFAYIINSNVWAGSDRVIIGPYHSNGGIRMDGTNNSSVSSGVDDWMCTGSFGCNPDATHNGVFGSGPNSTLWSFPSPPINFTGLSVDLSLMKTKAQTSGKYFAPSGNYGYHLIFKANGTFDVYRVTGTQNIYGTTDGANWAYERHVISAETFVGNYTAPSSCSVVFVEDKVWLEGVITKKTTVAAADVTTAGVAPSMILPDNITYSKHDGTVGLLAVAEDSILISLDSPDTMTLEGIFAAQNGRFGRNHYTSSGTYRVPNTYNSYILRTSLTVNGTIVSNGREGTKWLSGATVVSGYQSRTNAYDRALVSNPPPLTPHTSDTYKFIEWREEH